MVIRPITESEFARARETEELTPEPVVNLHIPTPDVGALDEMRAAFDDDDRMIAWLRLTPYTVRFEGQEVPMGGIGSVSYLPESRNRGNTNVLFAETLREMYDKGMLFSMIFPFSHAYFRKFDYELTHFRHQINLPTRSFIRYGVPSGRLAQWTPEDDDAPLISVYERFLEGVNLSVVRGPREWAAVHEADSRVKPCYTYIWYDEHGVPQAYFSCHIEKDGNKRFLAMDDYAWGNNQGLCAIFGMLRRMCAQYRNMSWSLPDWMGLLSMFPEPYDVEMKVLPWGMTRVLNAQVALETLHHPRRPGSYTIALTDAHLPENDGTWHVTFEEGQAKAEKVEDAMPDMRLDMRAFTQLIVGSVSLGGLLIARPELKIESNEETLRRVFHRRRVFLADAF